MHDNSTRQFPLVSLSIMIFCNPCVECVEIRTNEWISIIYVKLKDDVLSETNKLEETFMPTPVVKKRTIRRRLLGLTR